MYGSNWLNGEIKHAMKLMISLLIEQIGDIKQRQVHWNISLVGSEVQ